jgi:uncharacterized protein YjiS (DUF1127 family)
MTRSALSTMTHSGLSALEQIPRSFVALTKALKHRREVLNLAELDDRMLRDIGLTRADVSSALAEPLTCNPSWMLVRQVERNSRAGNPEHPIRQDRPVVPMVAPVKRYAA